MQKLHQTYRGLGLVFELNLDRFLFLGALGFALMAAAYLASL